MFQIILQYPNDFYFDDDELNTETALWTDAVPTDGHTFIDRDGNSFKVLFTSWEERDEGILTPIVVLEHF